MPTDFARVARVLRKPPHVIARRLLIELNARTDRFRAPRRGRTFDDAGMLAETGMSSVSDLWRCAASRVHALPVRPVSEIAYERACPGDGARILKSAEDALAHRVALLGSAQVDLGATIDWHTDFKTGRSWPPAFMRDIDFVNLDAPSDVKVPWELSRLQWLIPAGQAYLLTGDERYAAGVRAVLEDWIAANPYAQGVNWTCTMEAAMRILSWTWFFHVFARSRAWADPVFQSRFLRTLYLHGEFTERYLERAEINGNHFTADAVGMVFAGLFFGTSGAPARWAAAGWRHLCDELPRQVLADGVDFEASIPYHRLVLELFLLAARYREACGLSVPESYRQRVIDMARFTRAYTRLDGSTPLLGDADDARAVPFGPQRIGDHRYLVGLVGAHWSVPDLIEAFDGSRVEIFWALGASAAASCIHLGAASPPRSAAFLEGGVFVMRNERDHVCIDCGPVGLAGLGGHGHNDCLSFEAVLDGVHLVTDCGAYVYTASAEERNRFRSTASHNTPQVDGQEINRFIGPDQLWTLHNDARPDLRQWIAGDDCDLLVGSHSGFARLGDQIVPVRTIVLDHGSHTLSIIDECEGSGEHTLSIPLHLAVGVTAHRHGQDEMILTAGQKEFVIRWSPAAEWTVEIGEGRISQSYGVVAASVRLTWRRTGPLPATLAMQILPRVAAASSSGALGVSA